jgi:hypothetical protein
MRAAFWLADECQVLTKDGRYKSWKQRLWSPSDCGHLHTYNRFAVLFFSLYSISITHVLLCMKFHSNNGLCQRSYGIDVLIRQGPKLNSLYNYQCRSQSQIYITLNNNIWAINNVDVYKDNKTPEYLSPLRVGSMRILYTL